MEAQKFITECQLLGSPAPTDVTEDVIRTVLELWVKFQDLYKREVLMEKADKCLESLLICTGRIVFHSKYTKKISAKSKTDLKMQIMSCGEISNTVSCNFFKDVALVIGDKPWQSSAFNSVTAGKQNSVLNISDAAINNIWSIEGWAMLECRVEYLSKTPKTVDHMCSILHILVTKGHDMHKNLEEGEDDSGESLNPYRYSLSKYLQYLQLYGILIYKKSIDDKVIESWTGDRLLKTIKELLVERPINCNSGDFLMPSYTGWKEARKAAMFLAENATWRYLKSEGPECDVLERLYAMWSDVCDNMITDSILSGGDNSDISHVVSPLSLILDKLDLVKSTDSMYRIAIATWKVKAEIGNQRVQVLEMFTRALTKDLNKIEELKTSQPNETAKIRALHKALSHRYVVLTTLFKEHARTAKECLLTAFSLNPCEALFFCLFRDQCDSELRNQSELNQIDQEYNLTDLNEIKEIDFENVDHSVEDDLKLPKHICGDLDLVIQNPRYKGLFRWNSASELKELCSKLLQSKSVDVIENKSLDYVNVDFEKYKDLKPQYDPDDDGIQKFYSAKEYQRLERLKRKREMEAMEPQIKQKQMKVERTFISTSCRKVGRAVIKDSLKSGRRPNKNNARKQQAHSTGLPNTGTGKNPWWQEEYQESSQYLSSIGHSEVCLKLLKPCDTPCKTEAVSGRGDEIDNIFRWVRLDMSVLCESSEIHTELLWPSINKGDGFPDDPNNENSFRKAVRRRVGKARIVGGEQRILIKRQFKVGGEDSVDTPKKTKLSLGKNVEKEKPKAKRGRPRKELSPRKTPIVAIEESHQEFEVNQPLGNDVAIHLNEEPPNDTTGEVLQTPAEIEPTPEPEPVPCGPFQIMRVYNKEEATPAKPAPQPNVPEPEVCKVQPAMSKPVSPTKKRRSTSLRDQTPSQEQIQKWKATIENVVSPDRSDIQTCGSTPTQLTKAPSATPSEVTISKTEGHPEPTAFNTSVPAVLPIRPTVQKVYNNGNNKRRIVIVQQNESRWSEVVSDTTSTSCFPTESPTISSCYGESNYISQTAETCPSNNLFAESFCSNNEVLLNADSGKSIEESIFPNKLQADEMSGLNYDDADQYKERLNLHEDVSSTCTSDINSTNYTPERTEDSHISNDLNGTEEAAGNLQLADSVTDAQNVQISNENDAQASYPNQIAAVSLSQVADDNVCDKAILRDSETNIVSSIITTTETDDKCSASNETNKKHLETLQLEKLVTRDDPQGSELSEESIHNCNSTDGIEEFAASPASDSSSSIGSSFTRKMEKSTTVVRLPDIPKFHNPFLSKYSNIKGVGKTTESANNLKISSVKATAVDQSKDPDSCNQTAPIESNANTDISQPLLLVGLNDGSNLENLNELLLKEMATESKDLQGFNTPNQDKTEGNTSVEILHEMSISGPNLGTIHEISHETAASGSISSSVQEAVEDLVNAVCEENSCSKKIDETVIEGEEDTSEKITSREEVKLEITINHIKNPLEKDKKECELSESSQFLSSPSPIVDHAGVATLEVSTVPSAISATVQITEEEDLAKNCAKSNTSSRSSSVYVKTAKCRYAAKHNNAKQKENIECIDLVSDDDNDDEKLKLASETVNQSDYGKPGVCSKGNRNKTPRPHTPVETLEKILQTFEREIKAKAGKPVHRYQEITIKVSPSVVKFVEEHGGGLTKLSASYIPLQRLMISDLPASCRQTISSNPVKRSARLKKRRIKMVQNICKSMQNSANSNEDESDSVSDRSSSPDIEILNEVKNLPDACSSKGKSTPHSNISLLSNIQKNGPFVGSVVAKKRVGGQSRRTATTLEPMQVARNRCLEEPEIIFDSFVGHVNNQNSLPRDKTILSSWGENNFNGEEYSEIPCDNTASVDDDAGAEFAFSDSDYPQITFSASPEEITVDEVESDPLAIDDKNLRGLNCSLENDHNYHSPLPDPFKEDHNDKDEEADNSDEINTLPDSFVKGLIGDSLENKNNGDNDYVSAQDHDILPTDTNLVMYDEKAEFDKNNLEKPVIVEAETLDGLPESECGIRSTNTADNEHAACCLVQTSATATDEETVQSEACFRTSTVEPLAPSRECDLFETKDTSSIAISANMGPSISQFENVEKDEETRVLNYSENEISDQRELDCSITGSENMGVVPSSISQTSNFGQEGVERLNCSENSDSDQPELQCGTTESGNTGIAQSPISENSNVEHEGTSGLSCSENVVSVPVELECGITESGNIGTAQSPISQNSNVEQDGTSGLNCSENAVSGPSELECGITDSKNTEAAESPISQNSNVEQDGTSGLNCSENAVSDPAELECSITNSENMDSIQSSISQTINVEQVKGTTELNFSENAGSDPTEIECGIIINSKNMDNVQSPNSQTPNVEQDEGTTGVNSFENAVSDQTELECSITNSASIDAVNSSISSNNELHEEAIGLSCSENLSSGETETEFRIIDFPNIDAVEPSTIQMSNTEPEVGTVDSNLSENVISDQAELKCVITNSGSENMGVVQSLNLQIPNVGQEGVVYQMSNIEQEEGTVVDPNPSENALANQTELDCGITVSDNMESVESSTSQISNVHQDEEEGKRDLNCSENEISDQTELGCCIADSESIDIAQSPISQTSDVEQDEKQMGGNCPKKSTLDQITSHVVKACQPTLTSSDLVEFEGGHSNVTNDHSYQLKTSELEETELINLTAEGCSEMLTIQVHQAVPNISPEELEPCDTDQSKFEFSFTSTSKSHSNSTVSKLSERNEEKIKEANSCSETTSTPEKITLPACYISLTEVEYRDSDVSVTNLDKDESVFVHTANIEDKSICDVENSLIVSSPTHSYPSPRHVKNYEEFLEIRCASLTSSLDEDSNLAEVTENEHAGIEDNDNNAEAVTFDSVDDDTAEQYYAYSNSDRPQRSLAAILNKSTHGICRGTMNLEDSALRLVNANVSNESETVNAKMKSMAMLNENEATSNFEGAESSPVSRQGPSQNWSNTIEELKISNEEEEEATLCNVFTTKDAATNLSDSEEIKLSQEGTSYSSSPELPMLLEEPIEPPRYYNSDDDPPVIDLEQE